MRSEAAALCLGCFQGLRSHPGVQNASGGGKTNRTVSWAKWGAWLGKEAGGEPGCLLIGGTERRGALGQISSQTKPAPGGWGPLPPYPDGIKGKQEP